MKKRFLIFLLGLILGIVGFINFENLNIIYMGLIFMPLSVFFYKKNSDLYILALAIFIGFSLGNFKINSYNLDESFQKDMKICVLEKRKSNDSNRYTVLIKNKDYKQKAFLFTDLYLDIGDEFVSDCSVNLISKNTNPNLYNFRSYAISKNVACQIDLVDKDFLEIRKSKNIFLRIRKIFDSYVRDAFGKNLSKKSSDFVISFILAENLIDRQDLNKMGLAHIMAVSGLHIDILMGFIVFILKKFRISYKNSNIIALILCFLYAYAIGFAYSIQRVLIINTIGFLGFLYKKPVDKTKSLAIAAIIILLINPFALLNAGFILSFIACLGIYEIYPRFKSIFRQGFIRDNFAFTSTVQISTLPFVVYYFRYFNLLSILANFLIVPLFEISIYISFVIVFAYWIFRSLLKPLFIILDIFIQSILNMTSLLGTMGIFSFEFVAEPFILSLYLFALIFIFAKIKSRKYLNKFIGYSFLLTSIFVSLGFFYRELSYQMIDIGQGDAFLINDHGKYYMIDVGGPKYENYDSGERILIPYLKSLGIRELEAVFISHEDSDHMGNLKILEENIKIKNIITDDKISKEFKDKYKPKIMKKGQEVKLKSGKIICVFDGGAEGEGNNDNSLGLLMEIEGFKILSLGDLSSKYEDDLDIRADILKLSHHGSRSSSSKKFIESTDPKIALISAGRNNTYGHPNQEVLDNIDGIKTYNTQTDGLVKIIFEKNKIKVEKYLKGGFFR